MNPTLNKSSALQCFEHGNAIEILNGTMLEILLCGLSVQPVYSACQHGDLSTSSCEKVWQAKLCAQRQQGLAWCSCVEHSAIPGSSCMDTLDHSQSGDVLVITISMLLCMTACSHSPHSVLRLPGINLLILHTCTRVHSNWQWFIHLCGADL